MKSKLKLELPELEVQSGPVTSALDKQTVFVEVPASIHAAVKIAAAKKGQKLKEYLLAVIEHRVPSGEALACYTKRGAPVASASHQKRLILSLDVNEVVALKARASGFPSFREMVFSALEADGIDVDG